MKHKYFVTDAGAGGGGGKGGSAGTVTAGCTVEMHGNVGCCINDGTIWVAGKFVMAKGFSNCCKSNDLNEGDVSWVSISSGIGTI